MESTFSNYVQNKFPKHAIFEHLEIYFHTFYTQLKLLISEQSCVFFDLIFCASVSIRSAAI
jgi:hypothetical protein